MPKNKHSSKSSNTKKLNQAQSQKLLNEAEFNIELITQIVHTQPEMLLEIMKRLFFTQKYDLFNKFTKKFQITDQTIQKFIYSSPHSLSSYSKICSKNSILIEDYINRGIILLSSSKDANNSQEFYPNPENIAQLEETLVYSCIVQNNYNLLQTLIKKGANINFITPELGTPLMIAADIVSTQNKDSVNILKLLIANTAQELIDLHTIKTNQGGIAIASQGKDTYNFLHYIKFPKKTIAKKKLLKELYQHAKSHSKTLPETQKLVFNKYKNGVDLSKIKTELIITDSPIIELLKVFTTKSLPKDKNIYQFNNWLIKEGESLDTPIQTLFMVMYSIFIMSLHYDAKLYEPAENYLKNNLSKDNVAPVISFFNDVYTRVQKYDESTANKIIKGAYEYFTDKVQKEEFVISDHLEEVLDALTYNYGLSLSNSDPDRSKELLSTYQAKYNDDEANLDLIMQFINKIQNTEFDHSMLAQFQPLTNKVKDVEAIKLLNILQDLWKNEITQAEFHEQQKITCYADINKLYQGEYQNLINFCMIIKHLYIKRYGLSDDDMQQCKKTIETSTTQQAVSTLLTLVSSHLSDVEAKIAPNLLNDLMQSFNNNHTNLTNTKEMQKLLCCETILYIRFNDVKSAINVLDCNVSIQHLDILLSHTAPILIGQIKDHKTYHQAMRFFSALEKNISTTSAPQDNLSKIDIYRSAAKQIKKSIDDSLRAEQIAKQKQIEEKEAANKEKPEKKPLITKDEEDIDTTDTPVTQNDAPIIAEPSIPLSAIDAEDFVYRVEADPVDEKYIYNLAKYTDITMVDFEAFNAYELKCFFKSLKKISQENFTLDPETNSKENSGVWKIKDIEHCADNEGTIKVGDNLYAKIDSKLLKKLDSMLVNQFETALSKEFSTRGLGQNGIKNIGNKLFELKINAGNRIYTTKLYINKDGQQLIIFDKQANHNKIKSISNNSMTIIDLSENADDNESDGDNTSYDSSSDLSNLLISSDDSIESDGHDAATVLSGVHDDNSE